MDTPSRRVVFVSTRIAGNDGVSLEVEKWAGILEAMNPRCFYVAVWFWMIRNGVAGWWSTITRSHAGSFLTAGRRPSWRPSSRGPGSALRRERSTLPI